MKETIEIITELLQREQQLGPVRGLADLQDRQVRRAAIHQHVTTLEKQLQELRTRYEYLPFLPPSTQIRWAQAVQAMPNLAFLELDTTSLSADAEIIRFVLVDGQGQVLFDQLIKPVRPLSSDITRITGVSNEQIEHAPLITNIWPRLHEAMKGHYIISYHLPFDEGKLREAAQRRNLEEITFVGEDLMQQAMHFFRLRSYPKLEALCQRIGHPLPAQPQQTAIDRAHGQRHLLDAIAHGITTVENASPLSAPTSEEQVFDDLDDDRPFSHELRNEM